MTQFKCPSCGFTCPADSPEYDLYETSSEIYYPNEKKWVKLGYDTTDAQGNVIPYTTDEITVLCVNNDGVSFYLTIGEQYTAIFSWTLPEKKGHYLRLLCDDGQERNFNPLRFEILSQ